MVVVRRLIWDSWNEAHIARHKVSRTEVEEACYGEPVVQAGKKGRSLVFGPTLSGRMLTVVLGPYSTGDGVYYPVTARPMSRTEQAIYSHERRGYTK